MARGVRPARDSLTRLIPNMLTLAALCAGVTGMLYALDANWERAVIAVTVAGVLDGLDGRIARALDATSRFGAELDSLSDFVSFGVAPAVIVYLFSLKPTGGLGWALALLFAVCCALRLARFNTELETGSPLPGWAKNFLVGVPAPAGAGLALLPLILSLQFGVELLGHPALNALMLVFVAGLMVSRIPTLGFKRVRIQPQYVVFVLLGVGALTAFLVASPWLTLGAVGIAYLASLPYGLVLYRRRERRGPTFLSDEDDDEED